MKNAIKFVDLKTQADLLKSPIRQAMDNVLSHGKFIMGPEVKILEDQLSMYTGAKHVLSCSSGTDALLMALMAIGIQPGDRVLTTPFTFIATSEVISLLGGIPVFVDINKETFNIDPDKLEQTIEFLHSKGSMPKCIIPVDIFGLPADYDALNKIAEHYNLFVIEDAAQSFGACCRDKKTGNLTDIAATSFFPAKPLGCYGDGGAVFTNNEKIADLLSSIRVHGKGDDKYDNVRIGINGRIDTLQAAVLIEKLKIFDQELSRRHEISELYRKLLNNQVNIQKTPEGYESAWAQFSFTSSAKADIIKALNNNGIPWAVYYPKPLHLQKAFSHLNHKPGDFPAAENLSEDILSIPIHPYLTNEQVEYIAETVNKALQNIPE